MGIREYLLQAAKTDRLSGRPSLGYAGLCLVLVTLAACQRWPSNFSWIPRSATPANLFSPWISAIDCAGQAVKGVEVDSGFRSLPSPTGRHHPGALVHRDRARTSSSSITRPSSRRAYPFREFGSRRDQRPGPDHRGLPFHGSGLRDDPGDFPGCGCPGPVNADLGFGHSTGDLIIIDPAVPVTAASFGAVKALPLDGHGDFFGIQIARSPRAAFFLGLPSVP